jgi:hypothetical protein
MAKRRGATQRFEVAVEPELPFVRPTRSSSTRGWRTSSATPPDTPVLAYPSARIAHGSPRHKGCVCAQVRVEAVADGSTGDIFQVSETLPSSRLQVNEPAYRLPS